MAPQGIGCDVVGAIVTEAASREATVPQYRPGTHILLDFWGASGLDDQSFIEQAMRRAAAACNATVLETRFHHFGINSGVTGVALLAESHISIHTWPETGYVALDVFMCGDCRAEDAIAPLQAAFQPSRLKITTVGRGTLPADLSA
jgi:S-adenosylmethionine decarboxylase